MAWYSRSFPGVFWELIFRAMVPGVVSPPCGHHTWILGCVVCGVPSTHQLSARIITGHRHVLTQITIKGHAQPFCFPSGGIVSWWEGLKYKLCQLRVALNK